MLPYKQILTAISCAFAEFFIMQSVSAGLVVITTSDNAPTYVKDQNMVAEVVINTSTTVQFQVSDSNGANVYVTSSLPNGAYTVSDTGYSTPQETVTVGFNSGAFGAVNEVDITVAHDNSSPMSPQCTKGTKFRYKVCIPQISVPMQPGVYSNSYSSYDFHTQQTIIGCDDYTQIDWLQKYSRIVTQQGYKTGANLIVSNTGGFVNDGFDWQQVQGGHIVFNIQGNQASLAYDDHSIDFGPTSTVSLGSPATQYAYIQLTVNKLLFQDMLRRHQDGTVLSGCEYDWGFNWDNNNLTWANTPQPPQPSSIKAAAFLGAAPGSGKGEFGNFSSTDNKFSVTPQ